MLNKLEKNIVLFCLLFCSLNQINIENVIPLQFADVLTHIWHHFKLPMGSLHVIKPAFNELRRYNTRPSRFNWGRENVHFWKTYFRDPNINASIFQHFTNFFINIRRNFFCFTFFTKVPKNGPKKMVGSSKNAKKWPNFNSHWRTSYIRTNLREILFNT